MELSLGLSDAKIRSPINLSLSRACRWKPVTLPGSAFLSTRLHSGVMPKHLWNTGRQSDAKIRSPINESLPGTRAVRPGNSGLKLAVLGADSGVGRHLKPLVMAEPSLSSVHLYGTDAAHVSFETDDRSRTKAFVGPTELASCLKGMDLVMITVDAFEHNRESACFRWEDVFKVNGCVVKPLIEAVALNCPDAFIMLVTRPTNSLVPMAAQLMKNLGVYNPGKLFGIMKMQEMIVNQVIKELKGTRFLEYDVPIVGGNESPTVLPLISRCSPSLVLDIGEELVLRDEIIRTNTATFVFSDENYNLVAARASYLSLRSVIRGLQGKVGVYESGFVESTITGVPFFGSTVKLGGSGIEEVISHVGLPFGEMSVLTMVQARVMEEVNLGINFAYNGSVM